VDLLERLAKLEESIEATEQRISLGGSGMPSGERPSTGPAGADQGPVDRIVASRQAEAEAWLRKHLPDATIEMDLAAERIIEAAACTGRRQSALLAQGLESVRRALRALADELFPPQSRPVVDRNEKECRTDEGGYLTRLHLALEAWQDENGIFELDKSELDLFHQRLTKLNRRLASGIHGSGDLEEAEQLYADVWRVVSAYKRCHASPL
jgi:hypothetical protein